MSVGRHTIYNIAGAIAPMFVSIVTVPVYLHLIGSAEYGVLAIVWMFLGYFGVFDPGLSRATAYNIARLRDESPVDRQKVFWTAISINSAFGIFGGILLYIVARPIFGHLVKMPDEMRAGVIASLPWIAAAVPIGTIAGIFSGTLEGLNKFALINMLSFVSTLAFQVIPLSAVLFCGNSLPLIISVTVLVRFATAAMFFVFACVQCRAGFPKFASITVTKRLFAYGSWVTISNLIIPFLATLDKFLIGTYLGVVDVTIYTIPDNLTRRISIVPGSLSRALFPKISADLKMNSRDLFEKSFVSLLAVITPITVAGILIMHLFLCVWLGRDIADRSAPIGIILLVAIFMNSLAYLPSMYLQATGRPNLNAKFHLIEIIPHVLLLVIGTYYLKLVGVALAMLFVSWFDAILLFWAADLKIWSLRQFQIALLLVFSSVGLYFSLSPDKLTSYIPFALIILTSVIFFVRSSPILLDMAFYMLPSLWKWRKAT